MASNPSIFAVFQEELPMKISGVGRVALRLGLVAVLILVCVGPAETQDPDLDATFGMVKLKAGFTPDPFMKKLDAGGEIQTKKGDLTAWVAKAPDFKLFYEAGNFPLTIYVES